MDAVASQVIGHQPFPVGGEIDAMQMSSLLPAAVGTVTCECLHLSLFQCPIFSQGKDGYAPTRIVGCDQMSAVGRDREVAGISFMHLLGIGKR